MLDHNITAAQARYGSAVGSGDGSGFLEFGLCVGGRRRSGVADVTGWFSLALLFPQGGFDRSSVAPLGLLTATPNPSP